MRCVQDIGTLATFSKDLGEISDAAVYVKGNQIQWVGKTKDLPKEFSSADSTLSLPDHVLLPGLVNTHHHMFQCLTRCVAQARAGRLGPSCSSGAVESLTWVFVLAGLQAVWLAADMLHCLAAHVSACPLPPQAL